jgi:hypothetical protein
MLYSCYIIYCCLENNKITSVHIRYGHIFFPNIFDLKLVESIDVEPRDVEGWLFLSLKSQETDQVSSPFASLEF